MITTDPPAAIARCDTAHFGRESAVASSCSAPPPVSSLRSRRIEATANPAVISAMVRSEVAK
jgi:hypothetical protein